MFGPRKQLGAIQGKKIYVNADYGDDYRGDGSLDNPYRTIHYALTGNIIRGNASIPIVAPGRKDAIIANGDIQEKIVIEKPGLILCVLQEIRPPLSNDSDTILTINADDVEVYFGHWYSLNANTTGIRVGKAKNVHIYNAFFCPPEGDSESDQEKRANAQSLEVCVAFDFSEGTTEEIRDNRVQYCVFENCETAIRLNGGYGPNFIANNLISEPSVVGIQIDENASDIPNLVYRNIFLHGLDATEFNHVNDISADYSAFPIDLRTNFFRNHYASHKIDNNGDGIADLGPEPPPLQASGHRGARLKDLNPLTVTEVVEDAYVTNLRLAK